jgi:hypothetical protein
MAGAAELAWSGIAKTRRRLWTITLYESVDALQHVSAAIEQLR